MTMRIWYFRGLNSSGDDHIRFGVLKAGLMYGRLEKAFQQHRLEFISIQNIGAGPLSEQVARATQFIEDHPSWSKPGLHHFLGHSAGGLLARAVAHHVHASDQINSIVTLATPHQGASITHPALRIPEERPWLFHSLKLMGFNLQKKKDLFASFTPKSIREFNTRYPNLQQIHYASVSFSLTQEELSLPIRLLHHFAKGRYTLTENDGLIEVESQRWGHHLGHHHLDHLDQLGFHWHLHPQKRRRIEIEHQQMIQNLVNYWKHLGA